MTKKEFEERTGIKTTEAAYSDIEKIYLSAGNIDKDAFCKDYKAHCGSSLLMEFYNRVQTLEEMNDEKTGKINDTAELLIGKAKAYNDSDFRDAAIRLIGEKQVVIRTMEMDLPLWEEDKEFIKQYLYK